MRINFFFFRFLKEGLFCSPNFNTPVSINHLKMYAYELFYYLAINIQHYTKLKWAFFTIKYIYSLLNNQPTYLMLPVLCTSFSSVFWAQKPFAWTREFLLQTELKWSIMAFYCDCLQTYIPTVFENYTSGLEIEEQHIELSLWDTSGEKSKLY